MQVGNLSEQLQYSGHLDVSILSKACLKGLEPNSLKSYKSKFNSWKLFAIQNCLEIFPVNIIEFKIFLCVKVQEGACWSTINSTIAAVKFFNRIFAVQQDLVFEPSFTAYLKKFTKNPNQRRRPLKKEEFDSIFTHFDKQYKNDFVVARNLCVLMFSFFAFLRFDDLSQIRLCHVRMNEKIVTLTIAQAKNDYERKGQTVQFELHSEFYEIFSFYLYFSKFDKTDWSEGKKYLFYHVTKQGNCKYEKPITYDDMRFLILNMCQKAGVDITRIGTHSLRIGATSHATRQGVPDRVIDAHGRWAEGSRARQGYQRIEWKDLSVISEVMK